MLSRGVSGCVESANRPNSREGDRPDQDCDINKGVAPNTGHYTKGVAPNTVISDLSETEQAWLVLVLCCRPTCTSYTLLNLQTRNDFWETPSVAAFQWLSTLLTASLGCSDLDSATYSQIEAVLDPVEVAKLLWQDDLLTDNQLDNMALKPSRQFTLPICYTLDQQLFLFPGV